MQGYKENDNEETDAFEQFVERVHAACERFKVAISAPKIEIQQQMDHKLLRIVSSTVLKQMKSSQSMQELRECEENEIAEKPFVQKFYGSIA